MGEPKAPNPKTWVIITIAAALIVCMGAIVAALIGILPDIIKAPASPQPTSIPIVDTISAPSSSTLLPTSTTLPPAAMPTDTSISPTETIPSPTPAFYNQGEFAPLKNGVFVRLMPDFFGEIGQCQQPKPGFGVTLEFRTYSSGQFLLRYDPTAFSTVDDLGNNYPLAGAGTTRCDAFGIQNVQASDYTYMYLAFSGQFPLDAQYLVITADSLSGVKVVFHKLL